MSAQNYITALTDQQQIAALRQELAAKDREIAELRKELSAEKCELRWAYGEAQETDVEKCAWKQRAQQAESERDEARECVGRIYPALRLAMNRIGHSMDCDRIRTPTDEWDHTPPKPCSCHVAKIGAALTATPEHLRG